jgi:hypothetical protein
MASTGAPSYAPAMRRVALGVTVLAAGGCGSPPLQTPMCAPDRQASHTVGDALGALAESPRAARESTAEPAEHVARVEPALTRVSAPARRAVRWVVKVGNGSLVKPAIEVRVGAEGEIPMHDPGLACRLGRDALSERRTIRCERGDGSMAAIVVGCWSASPSPAQDAELVSEGAGKAMLITANTLSHVVTTIELHCEPNR